MPVNPVTFEVRKILPLMTAVGARQSRRFKRPTALSCHRLIFAVFMLPLLFQRGSYRRKSSDEGRFLGIRAPFLCPLEGALTPAGEIVGRAPSCLIYNEEGSGLDWGAISSPPANFHSLERHEF
jgi:hypothetical protein